MAPPLHSRSKGFIYILPVWPCPGESSDGATVSPAPPVSASSVCVGGLGSVCYIWSTSVLSGVLCEFKYALSNSLFLSISRKT